MADTIRVPCKCRGRMHDIPAVETRIIYDDSLGIHWLIFKCPQEKKLQTFETTRFGQKMLRRIEDAGADVLRPPSPVRIADYI